MLVKTVLCLTLLFFTSSVGYAFASKYRKRKQFFTQFNEFNQKFLQELAYCKRPLKEFLELYVYKSDFLALLEEYRKKIGEDNFFNEYFSLNTFLTLEEEKFIIEYFKQLGKGDTDSQKSLFSNRAKELELMKNNAEKEHKKYAELYVKLGVLVGLAIIIIII